MNQKKKIILSSIAAIMLGLTGCQSNTIKIQQNDQTVSIPKSPQKVVVMNYGALDTLDALGRGNIVIASSLPTIPAYLQQYNNDNVINTGRMKEPNLDIIKKSQPDLIIIDRRQAGKYDELSKIAPVLNLEVDAKNYIDSTKKNITLIGKITDTESLADHYVRSIEAQLRDAQVTAQKSNKKAIVAMHNDGKVMLTNMGGNPTLIHDVLQVKRAVQPTMEIKLAEGQRPKPIIINNQYVLDNKPDVIYLIDRSKAIGSKAMDKNYFDSKVLAKTKVVYLTADIWYLSGGGIESLEKQINEVIDGLK